MMTPATPAESFQLAPGTRVSKYEIIRAIGEGGMGRVYLAKCLTTGRVVAIKTLLPATMTPDFVEWFRGEAQKLVRLDDHPNIVRLHEFDEDPVVGPYLVMEYLKGKDLRSLVKAQGPLAVEKAVEIVLGVCAAVRSCHRRGVIHRDLKAGNVKVALDVDGEVSSVKVLDFGIAKGTKAKVGPEMTGRGFIVGTGPYMAPEQLGSGQVTPASDQYTIGVLLYFCVTGELPFKSERPGEMTLGLARAIESGRCRPARDLRPDLSDDLARIIERAMSVRPDARFPSVRDLGSALAALPCMVGRRGATGWAEYFEKPDPAATGEVSRRLVDITDDGIASFQVERATSSRGTLSTSPKGADRTIDGNIARRLVDRTVATVAGGAKRVKAHVGKVRATAGLRTRVLISVVGMSAIVLLLGVSTLGEADSWSTGGAVRASAANPASSAGSPNPSPPPMPPAALTAEIPVEQTPLVLTPEPMLGSGPFREEAIRAQAAPSRRQKPLASAARSKPREPKRLGGLSARHAQAVVGEAAASPAGGATRPSDEAERAPITTW